MAVGVVNTPLDDRAAAGMIAPLSERILAKLGPPWALWVVLWGSLTLVTYELAHRVYHVPAYPGIAFSLGSAYVNILSLGGVRLLAQRVNALQPLIDELVGAPTTDPRTHPFRLMNSTIGPLLLCPLTASVWGYDLLRHPTPGAITATLLLAIGWLPSNCAMWAIVTLFLGLDRLGRQELRLRAFHQDRSLGLAPLGQLASAAFTLFVVALVPFALATARDRQSTIYVLGHFAVGIAAFVLSLSRLHEQLMAARRRYLTHVRRLHAEAFAPVEAEWSLDALTAQTGRINAAKALEQHVGTIQRWPVGEAVMARMVAIGTSILTAVAVRLLVSKF